MIFVHVFLSLLGSTFSRWRWSFWLLSYWVFLKPRFRLLGNPLPRLKIRPKIVNMLSDTIWPLGIHMPAASIQEGLWFERWSGMFFGHVVIEARIAS